MATKKTTKKASAKAPVKKTATAKATTTTVKRVVTKPTIITNRPAITTKLPSNLINVVIAEIIGTFILTLVALFSGYVLQSLYVGLTLMLIVMSIGAISGAHINPAVTFGLWTMRKLSTVLVPFYWGAQFLGAMAAVVMIGAMTDGAFAVNFDHFMTFSWGVFAVELIGMAIFMFGIAAAISRKDLKPAGQAAAIGSALAIGLVASGALMPLVQSTAVSKAQEEQTAKTTNDTNDPNKRSYPREAYISGATLNPAVALAVTEKTETQLQSGTPLPTKDEKAYTRLSLEVIVATLVGAALGGNLFLLVNYRNKTEE